MKKKFISVIMAAVLCLSFAACGNNSGKSQAASEQQAGGQTAVL